MAEDINSIKPIIHKYLNSIRENKIVIERVFLFGSYAKGNARKDSDIDLAILSNDFIGDRFDDRKKIVPLRRKIDVRLEPVPYRPEDFKMNDPLVVEIMATGIELEV